MTPNQYPKVSVGALSHSNTTISYVLVRCADLDFYWKKCIGLLTTVDNAVDLSLYLFCGILCVISFCRDNINR